MTDPEKTTFGAVVVDDPTSSPSTQFTPQRHSLHMKSSRETTDLQPPSTPLSNRSTPGDEHLNPFSPFYTHAQATPDSDRKAPPIYTHDLESQCNLASTKSNVEQTKDCTMWPSRAAQKAKIKQEKKAKSWNPLNRLGKREKLAAQIVIALFIIGAAVGIGVGVSKAVGGGVWSGQGQTKPIVSPTNNNKKTVSM